VPSGLVRRLKQHFVTLPCGVDAILGLNGWIWLTATTAKAGGAGGSGGGGVGPAGHELIDAEAADAGLAEAIERQKRAAAERDIPADARAAIARVANAITALAVAELPIAPETIMDV
jgi:exosome complex component RRP4